MDPVAQPETALLSIMESVVFAYRYEPAERTFVLITDYPFPSPGSQREFVGFRFSDVDFEREPGDIQARQAHRERFQASGLGAIVVQDIRLTDAAGGRRRLELWFGPAFGGVNVTYAGVGAHTRGSVAEQVGEYEWAYRDARTNEPFDVDYPFPSLVGPGDSGRPGDDQRA